MSRGGVPRRRWLFSAALLGLASTAICVQAAAQEAGIGERSAPIYLELPQVEGLELPADFEASRRAAGRALGIASFEEMVRLSHTDRPVVEGQRPVLVLPALFEDSPEPPVTDDELRRVMFDGPAEPGTLVEFYDEMSDGRLDVAGEVAPWVRTRVTLEEASGELNGHGWVGDSVQAYVKHAIELADQNLDYGQFDNDGPDGVPNSGDDDGFVDLLVIDFPAVAGSCGGPGVWPHAGGLLTGTADTPIEERGPVPTDDLRPGGEPVRIGSYIALSAVDCAGEDVASPAVVAHELGHLLGVGDYYEAVGGIEPEKRRWLVGCFGLMSAGAWSCGTGRIATDFGPTHMAPYTKSRLGWIEIEEVPPGRDMVYELEPAQTTGRALRVPLGPDAAAESFLIEYRPRVGFDRDLPAGGVLIYHLDRFTGSRTVRGDRPEPTFFHLVEADADYGLLTVQEDGGDRGVATDVFARDGAVDSLTMTSTPSSRDNGGEPSAVTIHAMEVVGDRARIRLSYEPGFGAVNQVIDRGVQAMGSLDGHFEIVGGEPPFDVRPAPGHELPEGIEVSVDGRDVSVDGRPFEAGFHQLTFLVEDVSGLSAETEVAFYVFDPRIPKEQLIDAAMDPASSDLSPDQIHYLDVSGHPDGELDVADVRAALDRRGLIPPQEGS